MLQKRTPTDQLVSIIHVIQARQQHGFLKVWRGNGLTLEEGSITFTNGQITQAQAGWRNGSEALNWLCTWKKCDFIFEPATPSSSDPITDGGEGRRNDPLEESPARRQTGPLVWEKAGKRETRSSKGSSQRSALPCRTLQLDEALYQLDLKGHSRAHRLLLFWVDGRRSIPELMRLVKCNEDEMHKLLRDLELANVIQMS